MPTKNFDEIYEKILDELPEGSESNILLIINTAQDLAEKLYSSLPFALNECEGVESNIITFENTLKIELMLALFIDLHIASEELGRDWVTPSILTLFDYLDPDEVEILMTEYYKNLDPEFIRKSIH